MLQLTPYSEKGDMSLPLDQAGFLHTFALDGKGRTDGRAMTSWEIPQSLNLSVGGTGIIGRRISIYEDAMLRRQVAEGIVGWN